VDPNFGCLNIVVHAEKRAAPLPGNLHAFKNKGSRIGNLLASKKRRGWEPFTYGTV